jgi:hypothetical protein
MLKNRGAKIRGRFAAGAALHAQPTFLDGLSQRAGSVILPKDIEQSAARPQIVPPRPSHPIMRRQGADLEEKPEPRVALLAGAQRVTACGKQAEA